MIFVPSIPADAPFTAEQRAYLNGFLSGLFSRAPAGGAAAAPASASTPSAPLQPLAILVGSQTGNCEKLAKRLAQAAGREVFAPTIHDLGRYACAQLASEQAA